LSAGPLIVNVPAPSICLTIDCGFHEHLPVRPCCQISSADGRWGWRRGYGPLSSNHRRTLRKSGGRIGSSRRCRIRCSICTFYVASSRTVFGRDFSKLRGCRD
jgi:hypothetical protein